MGQKYSQLSLEERCSIAQWHGAGQSIRKIAAALDRQPSTVWREVKRNRGKKVGYKPSCADQQAKARRWRGSRLARQKDGGRISHESIHRFIYAEMRRSDDGSWRNYLPRAKSRRGHRARLSASPVHTIANRVCLAQRPAAATNRKQPGHWEADLMLFKAYSQNVLTVHERTSRFTVFLHQANKASNTTLHSLHRFFASVPQALRKTIAFDNGNEFALHHSLAESSGLATFFCDPHSPWQKGGVENAIGRMRRMLPTKIKIGDLTDRDFIARTAIYNHTPRKCLDFQTPAEVFSKLLLHFKCDSIRWPKAG